MRILASIPNLFLTEIGEVAFADLARIYPAGDRGHVFSCALLLDDPRFQQITQRLTAAGWHPWDRGKGPRNKSCEYPLDLDRHYEEQELAQFPYLELKPHHPEQFDAILRDDEGRIVLRPDWLHEQIDFASELPGWIIVPNRVRQPLEAARLARVQFLPTALKDPDSGRKLTWEGTAAPWWEITSDVVLPRVAPSMILRDRQRQPVQADFATGCYRYEGAYLDPELQYRSGDLAALPPWDGARTFEPFGGSNLLQRALVVSQRFYQVCQRLGLRAWFVPVRLGE